MSRHSRTVECDGCGQFIGAGDLLAAHWLYTGGTVARELEVFACSADCVELARGNRKKELQRVYDEVFAALDKAVFRRLHPIQER